MNVGQGLTGKYLLLVPLSLALRGTGNKLVGFLLEIEKMLLASRGPLGVPILLPNLPAISRLLQKAVWSSPRRRIISQAAKKPLHLGEASSRFEHRSKVLCL